MAILEEHFCHNTIRLYTSVFGTLFNEIKIKRPNGRLIKVPLSYSGQQKQNTIKEQKEEQPTLKVKNRVPRMGFKLISWEKDDSRMTNRNFRLSSQDVDRRAAEGVVTQYNRVPYNFTFELNVKTKHLDDLLQVVEQVLVYFNPSVQVVVNDNPDISSNTAINISLLDSSMQDETEGLYEDSRIVQATFNFMLEGYLYMPSSEVGVIKKIILNYYDLTDPDSILETDIIE